MTQSEREQYMDVVRERDMWREKYEREHAENARLRKKLGKVRRTALEKPFGAHTPSGKQLVKPSAPEPESEEERLRRRGGARHGHEGQGSGGCTSRTGTRATPSSRCARSASST